MGKILSASALPDDGMVDWFASFFIPDDGCLSLIGDAHAGDFVWTYASVFYGVFDAGNLLCQNLRGIVLNPAWLRKKLLKLDLSHPKWCAHFVKNDGATASGTLIDADNVFFHRMQEPVFRDGYMILV